MKTELLHGWEVETCVELPPTPDGDADYDNAKYRRFDCVTLEQARVLAKRLVLDDKFGSVAITEFVREPYEPGCPAFRKEYVSDSQYVDEQ